MLSVSHSAGTPPSLIMVRYMHLTRSSADLPAEYMNTWRLE